MQVEDIEQFITLTDYSKYAVSNFGNVKNIKTNRILKPAFDNNGYLKVDLGKTIRIHKLVASVFLINTDNKKCVDHIDCNKTNNKVLNLRYATQSENQFNAKINNRNTSGTKGISFHKPLNKWRAMIGINNKRIHIGYYDNIEDAIKARQEKAKELFGEFLNNCEK